MAALTELLDFEEATMADGAVRMLPVSCELIKKAIATDDWSTVREKVKAVVPTDTKLAKFACGTWFLTDIFACAPGSSLRIDFDCDEHLYFNRWCLGIASKTFGERVDGANLKRLKQVVK